MKKIGRYIVTVVPVLLGLAIQLFCSYAGGTIFGVWATVNGVTNLTVGYMEFVMYILIASQLIALLVFGCWYRGQRKNVVRRSFRQLMHGKTVLWIIFWGVGLQLFTNLALQVAYLIVPEAINNFSELMEIAGVGELGVATLVATVILGPSVEEIMFRGVTFRLAKKAGASFMAANVIQAVMFGIYHMNWVQGVYAGVLGLVLGYAAQKYGSLYPAILLHLSYNLAASVLSAVGEILPETIMTQVILAAVAVVCCVLGLRLFQADSKEEEKERVESQIMQGENL